MSAKAAIVIGDSANTPEAPGTPGVTNWTFTPSAVENGNVHTFYSTQTGSTGSARAKLTASISKGAADDAPHRFKVALAVPKVVTIDGIPTVKHVCRGFLELIFPPEATRDERLDTYVLLTNATGTDATIVEMRKNLEDLW